MCNGLCGNLYDKAPTPAGAAGAVIKTTSVEFSHSCLIRLRHSEGSELKIRIDAEATSSAGKGKFWKQNSVLSIFPHTGFNVNFM